MGMLEVKQWEDLPIGWRIALADYDIDAAQTFNKFGRNDDIDTANDEDVWCSGGTWVPPTAAGVVSVVSTDAADASAGTGGRTCRLFGLNDDFEEIEAVVTLDGTTPVLTTIEFLRVYRMVIETSGSSDTNVGDIEASIGGDPQCCITAEDGQSNVAIYTVPKDRVLLIETTLVSIDRQTSSAAQVSMRLLRRPFLDTESDRTWNLVETPLGIGVEGSSSFVLQALIVIPPKADVKLRVGAATDNNTRVSGGFIGNLCRLRGT